MGKIAFVFPGQGVQYPGMGRELAEGSPAAVEVFRMADILRPGTSKQCFDADMETLQQTAVTQPCLFTVELAAATALTEAGIVPNMVAGFSLGELSALSYCQVVDKSTTFELVCQRGALMQECAESVDTAMAAVIRLDKKTVCRICSRFEGVYPVNFNCPGQISVAGLKARMSDFAGAVKAAGGRCVPLKVSGGFHSPFMDEASKKFGYLLEKVEFRKPLMPLYSNRTGLPYGENPKELLASQICSPVLWENIVRNMIREGADTFIEVGPGNVLSGLIEKIDKTVRTFGVSDMDSLAKCISEVKPC